MNKTFKVKAKKVNDDMCDYITEGKVYDAELQFAGDSNVFFTIRGNGDIWVISAQTKNCPHINADWTIITEPAKYRGHVESTPV